MIKRKGHRLASVEVPLTDAHISVIVIKIREKFGIKSMFTKTAIKINVNLNEELTE